MLAEGLLDSHLFNNATQKHSLVIADVGDVPVEIAADLLAIHGLSGADNTASLHDIGKGTVLEISKKEGVILVMWRQI